MIRDSSSPGEIIKYRIIRNQGGKASRSLAASFSTEVSSASTSSTSISTRYSSSTVSSTSISTGSSASSSLHAQDKHFEGAIASGSTEKQGQELVTTFHENLETQEGGRVITGVSGITEAHNGAQSQISLGANFSPSSQFRTTSHGANRRKLAKTGGYSSVQTTFTSQTSSETQSGSGQTSQVGVTQEGLQVSSGEATTSSSSLQLGQENQLDLIRVLQEEIRQLKLKLASLGGDSAQVGVAGGSSASGQLSWDEEIKSLQTCSKEELLIKIKLLLEERKTLQLQSEYVMISSQDSQETTETDGKYVAGQGKVENGGATQVNKEVVKGTSLSLQAELHDVTQLYNQILTEKSQLVQEVERYKAYQKQVEEMKAEVNKTLQEEKAMIATLKSENNSLKSEKTKAEEEKVAKIEELKGLQQKLTTLKLENENLQAQNAKIEEEKASLIVKKQSTQTTTTIKVEGKQETLKAGGDVTLQSGNKSFNQETVTAKDTDVKKLQDELTALKTEYKTLMTQKSKLEEEKGTLLAEAQDNSMLQGEIDDLKFQLNSLISENTILTAEKTSVQRETSTKAEEERKRLQHELDTLKNNTQAVTVKSMQGELDALTLKLERMQDEKAKLEQQVGNTEITKVYEELSSLKGENETLKMKIAELQGGQGIVTVVAGTQSEVMGDKQKTTQEFTTYQTTSQVVTVTNTQGDMTSVHEELSSLKEENKILKTKIAELQGVQGSVAVSAQKGVTGDKQKMTQEFSTFQTSQVVTVTNAQGDLTSLLLENESLKNDKAKLERERAGLLVKEETLTTLEGEMTQMRSELSTLHTEYDSLKEEHAASVNTDVKKVRTELKALKSENDALKTQKTKLQEETGNLLAEVQKKTDEMGKMEKVQSQMKSLVSENEVLKTEKTKVMQEEAKKVEEERKRLQQQLATLRNTDQEAIIARMERELTSLKLESESWKAEKVKMEQERTTLTTKVDGVTRLEEELSSLQTEVKALQEEKVANKQVDVKKLQKELKSLRAENKAMKTEKSKVEEETQKRMTMQVKTLEEQLTILRSENETFKLERSRLKKTEDERMAEERKKLQEEMATLKITYQEQATKTMQGRLESLQLENESLKHEKAKQERERGVILSGETVIGGASGSVVAVAQKNVKGNKQKTTEEFTTYQTTSQVVTVTNTQGDMTLVHEELSSLKRENEILKTKIAELQRGQGSVVVSTQKGVTGDNKMTTQEFSSFQTTSQVVTVANAQGDMTSLLLENESLKNEKAKLEREKASLLVKEENLTTLEGEMTQMRSELSTLHTENKSLKEEHAAYANTDVKKVRVELKALKSENDALKTQKTKLQEETGNLLAEVQKKTDEMGKMEKAQSQVKNLVSENEVLKTEKTKVMQEEAKKAEDERKRHQQEVAALRNTDQEAIIARMERELTSLKLETESLKAEKVKMEQERTTLTTKVNGVTRLEEELSTLQAEVKALQEEKVANKQVDVKKLQKELASLQAENKTVKTEKSTVEERMKMQFKSLEEQLTVLRAENKTFKVERSKLKEKEDERMVEERKKLQEEMAALKITYQEQATKTMQGRLESLLLENESLKQEKAKQERERGVILSGETAIGGASGSVVAVAQKNVKGNKQKTTQEFTTYQTTSQVVTVTNTQGDMTSVHKELSSLKRENAILKTKIAEFQRGQGSVVVSVQKGVTGDKQMTTQEFSTFQTSQVVTVTNTQGDMTSVNEELSTLKRENEILKTKIAELQRGQGSVAVSVQKGVTGDKQKMTQEFTTFQTSQVVTVANTQGDLTSLLLENESLKNDKAKLEREKVGLLVKEEKLTTLEGEMTQMRSELSTLHTENKSLKEEHAAYTNTDVKKVHTELKALKSENDALKTQKTKLQEETGNLLAEVQKNTDVLGKMEKVQSQVKSLVSENEVLKTEKTKVMQEEAKKAEEERKRLQQELAALRNTDQEAIIARMERELTSLKLESESWKAEKVKMEQERTTLTTRVDGVTRLEEELSSLKTEVKALQEEKVANKQVNVKKLQKQLTSLQAEKNKVEEEKRSLVVETQEKMKMQVKTLEDQLTILRSENETFKLERSRLKKTEDERMAEERKKLQEEMATLKITYQEQATKTMQGQLESLLLENEGLRNEKAKLEREKFSLSHGERAIEEGGAGFVVQTKMTTSRREVQTTKGSATFRSEAKGLNEIEVIREEMEGERAAVSQLKGRSVVTQDFTKLQEEMASLRAENQTLKAELLKLGKERDMLLSQGQSVTLTEVREVANTQQTTIISESSSQVTTEKQSGEYVNLSKTQEATDSTLERIREEMSTLQTLLEEKDELHDADDAGDDEEKQDTTDNGPTNNESDSASLMKEIETLKSEVVTLRSEKEKYETLVMGKWQVIDLQGDGALQLLQEENRKLRAYIEENDMQIAAMQTSTAAMQTSAAQTVQVQTSTSSQQTSSTSSSTGKQGSQSTEEENKTLKKQIEEMQLVQGNLQQALAAKLEESSANVTRMQLMEMEVTQLYQLLQQHGVSREQVQQITTSVQHTEGAVNVTETVSSQSQSIVVTQQSEEVQSQTTKTTVKSSKLSRLEEEAAKMAQKRKKLQQELASLKTSYQEEGAAKTQEVTMSQKSEMVLTQTAQGTVRTSLSMELEQEMSSLKSKLQDYEQIQTELAETKKELAKFTADKNGKGKSKKAAKESQATQEKIDMLQMQVKELSLQVKILSTSKTDLDDTRKQLAELKKENTSLSGQLGKMKAMEREVTIARSVIQQLKDDNEKMALKMKKSKK
ncbi:uncharacterized protein LOC144926608 [Branchiostoma floridae x Branchiostoma belcheri]